LCTIEVKWGNAQWVIKRSYGQFQAFDAWTNHYVRTRDDLTIGKCATHFAVATLQVRTINQLPYPLPPAKKFVKPKEKNVEKRTAEMKKYIAGISSFVHLFLSHKVRTASVLMNQKVRWLSMRALGQVGRAMVLRFFAPIQVTTISSTITPCRRRLTISFCDLAG
jgi:hypothetical protein